MAKDKCGICKTRAEATRAQQEKYGVIFGKGMCIACHEEGTWENEHNDNGHDKLPGMIEEINAAGARQLREIAKRIQNVKNYGTMSADVLRAELLKRCADEAACCWICQPELNRALKPVRAEGERASRKGQKINVPLIAPGEVKAAVVIKKADEENCELLSLPSDAVRLIVRLAGLELRLAWDFRGNYDYEESYAITEGNANKKVRNVAEALRMIEAAGILG